MSRTVRLQKTDSLDGQSVRRRIARAITEIFAPAPTVAALLVVVSWHSAATAEDALRWAFVSVLFASLIPLAYIIRGVRRQRLSDHHVGVREQRPLVLLFGIGSVLVGVAALLFLGAPREIVALVGAMAVGLLSSMLVTLFWKISVHSAVIAGTMVTLILVFGPLLFSFGLVVALVAWARVEIGDHTPAQVITGVALGAAVAGTTFPLWR